MSIVINVEQYPLSITPSNAEHVYTFSSSGATLTNFKYIVDIYFRADEIDWSNPNQNHRVARLKVRPNTYNKAIMDVGEIVRTLLLANPRFSGTTYPYLNPVADENSVITLSDAQETRSMNAYNLWENGSENANLQLLWQVQKYRVIVGCEYESGSSIITDIDPEGIYQPQAITIFPGVDNTLVPEPYLAAATLGSGYTGSANFFQVDNQSWYYYDLFRHVYQRNDACECHSYSVSNPSAEDNLSYSYTDCISGVTVTISLNPQTARSFCACSGSIVQNEGPVEDITPTDNGLCNGFRSVVDCGPKEFLNAGGTIYQTISQPGYVNQKVRRRMHHVDCPMIVSFLNGRNEYFTNDIYSIGIRSAKNWGDPYTYSAESINRTTLAQPQSNEPINSQFKMLNFYLPYNITSGNTLNAIPTDSQKVCFYGTSYNPSKTNRLNMNSATTEVIEYYIQPQDCINNPIHLLFLNGRGMWDTYTFGKKSTKTINLERKKYQQEASLNKQFYARGSNQRGQTVYEQIADYQIKCASWFMDENDTEIVQELFMSPEVYVIEGTIIKDLDCVDCRNPIYLYQHLIPVVINDTDFEVYEQQYQKIFQYTFTLSYGNVKRFRTQG